MKSTLIKSSLQSHSSFAKTPPKAVLRPVGRAIADFDMIHEGDRILLGLSGGKDSLALLHILIHLQRHAPINFELGVITIDPEVDGFEPSRLKKYLNNLALPYFYEQHAIMAQAKDKMIGDSFCSYCSRMKRGIMYRIAREQHYNVLALAQHLDDLAESFLMSAFHAGQLRTMKANYTNKEGDVRIIRPLVYVREAQTRDFAQAAELPVIIDNCPACFEKPTQRQHMKELLSAEEKQNKQLFGSLLSTMRPLITKNTAD